MITETDSIRVVELPDLGTVTDASFVVGERAGSGLFAATALKSYVGGDYLPLAGGTVHGPTVFSGSVNFTATGSPIGGVGSAATMLPQTVPVFQNYQGTGNPSFSFPTGKRFIIDRAGASAHTDFGTLQVGRTVTHTTGTMSAINAALRVETTITEPLFPGQEHGIISRTISNATAENSAVVGGTFQGIRNAGAKSWVWGATLTAWDKNYANSSVGVKAVIGVEVNVQATDLDDGLNANTWGGTGIRKMIQLTPYMTGDVVPKRASEISSGIWFAPGEDNEFWTFGQAIGMRPGLQTYSVFDARGAVAPPGYANPVAAVRMEASQIIDFNGGPELNSAAGNYLQYRSGKLYYVVGGVDKLSIDASGNVRAAGTVTGSVAP
jgi:hypothetical protein